MGTAASTSVDLSFLNENSREVKTLQDFIGIVEERSPKWGFMVHRGQHRRGNLLPGIARENPATDTTKLEKLMLKQLELVGASLLAVAPSTQLDRLVLAQHFGMKTRLLDWTGNPLAALWFACSDARHKEEAYVYSLDASTLLVDEPYDKDPFSFKSTVAIQPRSNDARVLAQEAWFTLHRYSKAHSRFVLLETHKDAKARLLECRVPAGYRNSITKSLERYGVSARTLFPDLAGLCTYLNWKHVYS